MLWLAVGGLTAGQCLGHGLRGAELMLERRGAES